MRLLWPIKGSILNKFRIIIPLNRSKVNNSSTVKDISSDNICLILVQENLVFFLEERIYFTLTLFFQLLIDTVFIKIGETVAHRFCGKPPLFFIIRIVKRICRIGAFVQINVNNRFGRRHPVNIELSVNIKQLHRKRIIRFIVSRFQSRLLAVKVFKNAEWPDR